MDDGNRRHYLDLVDSLMIIFYLETDTYSALGNKRGKIRFLK